MKSLGHTECRSPSGGCPSRARRGLHVYDPEPLPEDSPLLKMDNVVLSPHMAAHIDESLYRMAMVVTDVLAVIEGRKPENPVPPPA